MLMIDNSDLMIDLQRSLPFILITVADDDTIGTPRHLDFSSVIRFP